MRQSTFSHLVLEKGGELYLIRDLYLIRKKSPNPKCYCLNIMRWMALRLCKKKKIKIKIKATKQKSHEQKEKHLSSILSSLLPHKSSLLMIAMAGWCFLTPACSLVKHLTQSTRRAYHPFPSQMSHWFNSLQITYFPPLDKLSTV